MFLRRPSTTIRPPVCGVCGLDIEDGQISYCSSITATDYSGTCGPQEVMMPCHPACMQSVLSKRVVRLDFKLNCGRPEETLTTAERFETMRADPTGGQLNLAERHLLDLVSNQ